MAASNVSKILLFPLNGNSREAVDALAGGVELLGFIDDAPEKRGQGPYGVPVFGREALAAYPEASVLAVPGSAETFRSRRAVIEALLVPRGRYATVIHPTASVSRFATVGRNVLVMAGAVITSNAVIGDHVCILPNAVIHHDAVIGDWTLIGAGVTIAGGTRIGENCYIGSGSSIIHGVTVGDRALVGLGANVIRDVGELACVAGNPARELRNQTGQP